MSEKMVVIDLGTVRILNFDHLNYVVERYEKVSNKKGKWRLKGYTSTIYKALSLIMRYEWLVDEDAIKDVKDYVKQVDASNNKLMEVLNDTVVL